MIDKEKVEAILNSEPVKMYPSIEDANIGVRQRNERLAQQICDLDKPLDRDESSLRQPSPLKDVPTFATDSPFNLTPYGNKPKSEVILECCGQPESQCRCDKPKPDEKLYPCANCGRMRTADEGGTTFTVCDKCWKRSHSQPSH